MNYRQLAVPALLIVSAGSFLFGQSRNETKLVASANLDKVIGSIKWSVTETATGKVLAKGERIFRLRDVVVGVHKFNHSTMYAENVLLGAHFRLGRPEQPQPSVAAFDGFGLTLDKDNESTFSYEWFNVTSPHEARKLQEKGKLGIMIGKIAGGYAEVRTDFLTDVSMRALRIGDDPSAIRWRAQISKGSWISWPCVRNGGVVVN